MSLAQIGLSGFDLSELDLRYAAFWGANRSAANLSGADLSKGEFGRADLDGAAFTKADVTLVCFATSVDGCKGLEKSLVEHNVGVKA